MNCRCFAYLMVLIIVLSSITIMMDEEGSVDAYAPEVITDYSIGASYPQAHGNHVVYQVFIDSEYRVFMKDIRTNVETRITNFESQTPDISGDRIVFKGYRDSQWDIFMYSISSTTLTRLTNDVNEEYEPKIDGIDIVYYVNIGGNFEVMHMNAITQNFRRLSMTSGFDGAPNVHDGMVVWQSRPDFYSIIMGHDLGAGITFEVANETGFNLTLPDIYGDRVVYERGTTYEHTAIWFQNMTNDQFILLSDGYYRSSYPRIFRENIVFITLFDRYQDVMLFNLDRGYEQRLTADFGYDDWPCIWGEHVYYETLNWNSYVSHILLDYDDDGIPDQKDMFPYDHNEHFDFDGDGMGDYKDYDDDNDGFEDPLDAFPRNPDEWYDFDGDGVGDNYDEDDDNDGIPDGEDPDPRDPNTPIIGFLHDLLIRLDQLEENLMDRIIGLEEVLAGMSQEDTMTYFEHINNSLIDLETALSNMNFSFHTGIEGILVDLENLGNEIGSIAGEREDPFDVESFFDVFADLMVNVTQGLFEYMEVMLGAINDTARGLNETENALNALNTLDDIVTELEGMGRNIESQNEDIEDTGSGMRMNLLIMIIVLSIWSIIILALLFYRTDRYRLDDIEDD